MIRLIVYILFIFWMALEIIALFWLFKADANDMKFRWAILILAINILLDGKTNEY